MITETRMFTATQRCPRCDSSATMPVMACENCKARYEPPKLPFANYDTSKGLACVKCKGSKHLVVAIKCKTCQHEFAQNDTPNMHPVLVCDKCRSPRSHMFDRKVRHERPRPPIDGKPQAPEVFCEIMFSCSECGSIRKYGKESA